MQNRLARIFNPRSGRTVMLAIDHGYFLGPTSGLERVDVNIVPLLPYADALMLTRGILRTTIPPSFSRGVVMRASGGPSIRKELSNEQLAVDIEDGLRMNVAAMAVQVFIGGEYETQTVNNMTRMVDMGNRYGIPTLGVTAVGKDMVRDAQYFRLATRICAELGAQFVKTYYVDEDFETVTASCPVPIVMAGGKKLPELDALTMAYRAVTEGAAGVDMGRNIFQSDAPVAMIQAVQKVVHELMKPEHAYELYQTLRHEKKPVRWREQAARWQRPLGESLFGGWRPGVPRQPSPGQMVNCQVDNSQVTTLDLLRSICPTLSVGILTADLLALGSELAVLERAGVGVVHVDVMDGCFTPMMTVGPPFVKALTHAAPQGRAPDDPRAPGQARGLRRGRRRHHHRAPGVVRAHPPRAAGPRRPEARGRPFARDRARPRAQPRDAAVGARAAAARDRHGGAAGDQPGLGRAEVHPGDHGPRAPGPGDDGRDRAGRSSCAWTAA